MRCRLVASWGWSRSQGLGCSPIKAARELGLERRSLRPHGVIRGCSPAHIGEILTSLPNMTKDDAEGRRHTPKPDGMEVSVPVTTSSNATRRWDSLQRCKLTDPITRRPLERGWRHSLCLQKCRSNMRETVRSLSSAGVGDLRGAVPSTRGPGRTHL